MTGKAKVPYGRLFALAQCSSTRLATNAKSSRSTKEVNNFSARVVDNTRH